MAPQVLLVDDDTTSQAGITGHLEDVGIFVQTFTNGQDALHHLQQQPQPAPYTAVLLDYVLDATMSGEQLLNKVRVLYPDLPVIVFTGLDPKGGMQALGEGAYASLRRPLDHTELALIIHNLADQHAVFPQIVRDLRAVIDAGICLAWRLERKSNSFQMDAWAGDLTFRLDRESTVPAEAVRSFFADGLPRFFADLAGAGDALLPTQRKIADANGRYALVAIPLLHRQRLVGFLDCYVPAPAPTQATMAPEIMRLLTVLGKRCAEAVQNATLSQSLQAMQELNQVLADTLDEETILEQILQKALELVGCEIGWLYLLDPDANKLKLRALAGVERKLLQEEREISQGITGAVARSGRSYVAKDVDQDPIHQRTPGVPAKAEMAVPLRRGEQTIGVLSVKSRFPDHFAEEDLTLLTTLAAQATTAIGRARLVNALQTMSRLAVSAESFEPLARYVVHSVRALTGATVMLWMMSKREGEGDKVMRIVYGEGEMSDEYRQTAHLPNDPTRSINAYALHHAQPIVRADVQAETPGEVDSAPPFYYLEEARQHNWHAFMAAPLIGSGEARLGVLSLYSPFIDAFGPAECELVMTFANQAATALQQQQRRVAMQQLATIGQELTGSITDDPRELLKMAAEAARTLLKADCAVVYPYDPIRERFYQLEQIVAIGNRQPLTQVTDKPRQFGLAAIVRYVGRLVAHDIEGDRIEFDEAALVPLQMDRKAVLATIRSAKFIKREGVQAFVGISLQTHHFQPSQAKTTPERDVELGVLYLDFRAAHHFSQEELQLIDIYANYVANIIQSARLYTELKAQRQAQIAVVRRMTQAMVRPDQLTTILQGILTLTLALMQEAALGVIRLLNPVTGTLEVVALAPAEAAISAAEITERGDTLDGWLMAIDQAQQIADIAQTTHYQPLLPDAGSALVAPIRYNGATVGLLTIEQTRPHAFTEDDRQWTDAVVGLIGVAVDNNHLFTQLEQQVDRLNRLHGVSTEILAATTEANLDQLLHLILRHLSDMFANSSCSVRLYNAVTQEFSSAIVYGNLPANELQREPRIGGISRHAIRTGKAYYVENTEATPTTDRPTVRIEIREQGIRAIACLPLNSANTIIGLLYLNLSAPHVFSLDEKRILELFADQAAVAIRNAQLYSQLAKSRSAQIDTIYEITNAILLTSAAGPAEVLQPIVDRIAPLLGQNDLLVNVRLLDKTTDELVLTAIHTRGALATQTLAERMSVHKGIAGWAVRENKIAYVTDVKEDVRYIPGLENARSELAVPLERGTEVIGVLVVEHPAVNAFTQYEIDLTEAIGQLAVVALENATLYNNLAERSAQLEALYNAGLKVSANVRDRWEVLQTIVESIHKLLDADVATIFAYDAKTNQFDEGVRYGHGLAYVARPSNNGNSIHLVHTRQAVFKTEAMLTERERVVINGKTVAAYAGIPLLVTDECVGILYINYFEDYALTENEKKLAQLFGLQAAVAIQNARQYELAEKLAKAERWAELGKLAGGLAHRIGNKGGTIRLRSEELAAYLRTKAGVEDKQVYTALETITRNNQYILDLSEMLFKPFRAIEEGLHYLDLKLLINSAIHYAVIPPDVKVTVQQEENLPRVTTNRFFVEVFVEIINNAVEAMHNCDIKELRIESRYDMQWVTVSFTDTGRGISAEELDKIFNLFSTTRADTEEPVHHGFGLWWVRTFLLDIGGDITVNSQANQGTTFTVYIQREN